MSEQASRPDERVFLVVVDESPEMRNALRYACRRAKRTGGRVAMLYVMEPPEGQQWGAVMDLMRQEARQQAEEVIAKHADVAVSLTGQPPAIHIREGKSRDELVKLITEDRSISVLVLASASSNEGPGPLVTAFAGKLGSQLRVPLTIVPGALSEAQIDAIS
jgi:nucleotide-binding universal stress UspA family protein